MSSTPSLPAGESNASVENAAQGKSGSAKPWQVVSKPAGYGMPCVACRTYYAADLVACPVCKSTQRIPAAVSAAESKAPAGEPCEPCPDPAALEQERERFLREFKAQLLASQTQMHSSASSHCIKTEHHPSAPETAAVCQSCYDQLQERVDVLEAALHIDIKEAAQIVYDAVWADSSDSSKSYENAAAALLNELRKRSGVTPTFGLMKPLTD